MRLIVNKNSIDKLKIESFSIEEDVTYHELKDLLTELKEEDILIHNNAIEPDKIYLDWRDSYDSNKNLY